MSEAQTPPTRDARADSVPAAGFIASDAIHAPWWRVGMMWMVVGGPLAVVVAGVATAVIAARGADPVLTPAERGAFAERPALAGRNHAGTGEVPGARR